MSYFKPQMLFFTRYWKDSFTTFAEVLTLMILFNSNSNSNANGKVMQITSPFVGFVATGSVLRTKSFKSARLCY